MIGVGDTLQLRCDVTSGSPAPSITWQLRNDGEQTIALGSANQSVFELTSATPEDSGVYMCSASNGVGASATQLFTVTVHCESALFKLHFLAMFTK